MRDQLLKIISENPKRYSQIVKKDSQLWQWVQQHSHVADAPISAQIFSAVSDSSPMCPNGNLKPLRNQTQGWGFCGPAKTCKCLAENLSCSVKLAKSQYSSEQHQRINAKRQSTMMEKYGVAYNSQRSDIHHIWQKPKVNAPTAQLLNDAQWLGDQYIIQQKSLVDIAHELGVYYGTVGDHCRKHGFEIRQRSNYSLEEKQISQWLTELGIAHITGDWSQLGDRELDIWIPQRQLAIEINGLYWHSFHPDQNRPENRLRHLEKTQLCEQKNIQLLHVTDAEWRQQPHVIKNLILSHLGMNQKIAARKCRFEIISNRQSAEFFQQFHLQSSTAAHRSYGLFYDHQLIMSISVGRSRFDTAYPYELLRLCSRAGYTVVGGITKLMTHISQDLKSHIVTYCDRSKSRGRGYLAAGFELLGNTEPGYFWTDGTTVISRHRAQKKKLASWLPNFNPALSESSNMFANQYRRFWDCGNFKWVWRK
jgi:G:T-mismatch repair DNA endonuclease (very short patch repair protein)